MVSLFLRLCLCLKRFEYQSRIEEFEFEFSTQESTVNSALDLLHDRYPRDNLAPRIYLSSSLKSVYIYNGILSIGNIVDT